MTLPTYKQKKHSKTISNLFMKSSSSPKSLKVDKRNRWTICSNPSNFLENIWYPSFFDTGQAASLKKRKEMKPLHFLSIILAMLLNWIIRRLEPIHWKCYLWPYKRLSLTWFRCVVLPKNQVQSSPLPLEFHTYSYFGHWQQTNQTEMSRPKNLMRTEIANKKWVVQKI